MIDHARLAEIAARAEAWERENPVDPPKLYRVARKPEQRSAAPFRRGRKVVSVIATRQTDGHEEYYDTMSEAARALGMKDIAPIWQAVNGRRLTAMGRTWRKWHRSEHRAA